MSTAPLETDQKLGFHKKIGIIEDVESLASLYAQALEFKGYSIVANSRSAEEFLELLEQRKELLESIEIAIIDYRLGVMNGFDLAKILLEKKPSIHIIFASAEESIEREARSAGFAYLRKPFTMNLLIEEINRTGNS